MTATLIDKSEIARSLSLPEATIDRLRRQSKIPAVKLGYRTFRYNLERVEAALQKLELRAVGGRGR